MDEIAGIKGAPATTTCRTCRMAFDIGEPGVSAQRLTCSDCGRAFWCGQRDNATTIHVGVRP
jgi:hypothetical protein